MFLAVRESRGSEVLEGSRLCLLAMLHILVTRRGGCRSSFQDTPSAAGPSLAEIMKFAMDNIPPEFHSKTPVLAPLPSHRPATGCVVGLDRCRCRDCSKLQCVGAFIPLSCHNP
jgi:hypothetical protein